jgi:hypothetical protein
MKRDSHPRRSLFNLIGIVLLTRVVLVYLPFWWANQQTGRHRCLRMVQIGQNVTAHLITLTPEWHENYNKMIECFFTTVVALYM